MGNQVLVVQKGMHATGTGIPCWSLVSCLQSGETRQKISQRDVSVDLTVFKTPLQDTFQHRVQRWPGVVALIHPRQEWSVHALQNRYTVDSGLLATLNCHVHMRRQPVRLLAHACNALLNFHMMASCEPHCSSAYSEDLRWRMVWQSEALGCSYGTIAKNLNVDKSTICRTIQLFYSTGTVTKCAYLKDCAARKLSKPAQLFILHLVIKQPGIYLYKIQKELSDLLGIEVFQPYSSFYTTMVLPDRNFKSLHLQRDEFLRQQYVSDVSVYSPEMLVFLDETGADCQNAMRKYGYRMRAMPLVSHQPLVWGERVSALAIISVSGLLDVKVVRGTTNGDTFYDFIQENLLPNLMPFNGENPYSVVMVDNCSIHNPRQLSCMDICKWSLLWIKPLKCHHRTL